MALTVSIDTGIGASFSSAHAVITEFSMMKQYDAEGNKTFTVTYAGLIYVDASKYTAGKSAASAFSFTFALDVTDDADQHNLLKQCYLNLKTQNGFTDGVDA